MALFQKIPIFKVPGAKSAKMALFGKFELLSRCQKCQKCLRASPRIRSEKSQVPKVPRRHFFQNHAISTVPSAKSASSPPQKSAEIDQNQ